MAIKNLYLTNGVASGSNHHALQDGGSPPTLARLLTGWIVSTTAPTVYALMAKGVERAATAQAATAQPAAAPNNAVQTGAGDSFRSPTTYDGTFTAGTWTISFLVEGETRATSTHDGRINFRIWRGTSATTATTEITSGIQTTTQYGNLNNSTYQGITASVVLPAITMTNEYLFVQVAHRLDGAGNSTTSDTHLGVGTSGGFTAGVVTPDFGIPVITESGALALDGLADVVADGVRQRYPAGGMQIDVGASTDMNAARLRTAHVDIATIATTATPLRPSATLAPSAILEPLAEPVGVTMQAEVIKGGVMASGGTAGASATANAVQSAAFSSAGTTGVSAAGQLPSPVSVTMADSLFVTPGPTGTRTATASVSEESVAFLVALRSADASTLQIIPRSTMGGVASVIKRVALNISGVARGQSTLAPSATLRPSATLAPTRSRMFSAGVLKTASMSVTANSNVVMATRVSYRASSAINGTSTTQHVARTTKRVAMTLTDTSNVVPSARRLTTTNPVVITGASTVSALPFVTRSVLWAMGGASTVVMGARAARRGALQTNGAAITVPSARRLRGGAFVSVGQDTVAVASRTSRGGALVSAGVASVIAARRARYGARLQTAGAADIGYSAPGTKGGAMTINGVAGSSTVGRVQRGGVLAIAYDPAFVEMAVVAKRQAYLGVTLGSNSTVAIRGNRTAGGVLATGRPANVSATGIMTASARAVIAASANSVFNAGENQGPSGAIGTVPAARTATVKRISRIVRVPRGGRRVNV